MGSIVLYNVIFALTGLAISPFMTALIKRYSREEKIIDKDFFNDVKFDWKVALVTSLLIILLLYFFGVSEKFFLYSILSVILVMEAFVDIKAKILPNSLNFAGFLIGIVYTYITCVRDIYAGLDLLLGMVTGAGVFLLIALFALIVYRREGMGLGDVKLMGMLGLFFGFTNIIQIFILSFFVAAVVSIILLATRIKKTTDYIAFGPFIVIATVATMIIPASKSIEYLMTVMHK